MNYFEGRTILLTGGTGSFGHHFARTALDHWNPRTIRIFSRDELKQSEMQRSFDDDRLRFLIGDVRDRDRMRRAVAGADIVIHAAAMKQVPACEYNPFEAVQTNILGTQNVAEACIEAGIPRAVALSTDKAVSPASLYGATKLCAEKLFVQANVYAGHERRASLVRSIRERRRISRQCGPPVPQPEEERGADGHRRTHDPLLDHAGSSRAIGRGQRRRRWPAVRCSFPRSPAHA